MLRSWAKKYCKLLPLSDDVSNFYFRYDFVCEKNQYVLDMCSCTSFYIRQDTTAEMEFGGQIPTQCPT